MAYPIPSKHDAQYTALHRLASNLCQNGTGMLRGSSDEDKARSKKRLKRFSAVNDENFGAAAGVATLLALVAVAMKWLNGKYPGIFDVVLLGIVFLSLTGLLIFDHIRFLAGNILQVYRFAIVFRNNRNSYCVWLIALPVVILFVFLWFLVVVIDFHKSFQGIFNETDFRSTEFALLGLFSIPVVTVNVACQALVSFRRRKRKHRSKAASPTRNPRGHR